MLSISRSARSLLADLKAKALKAQAERRKVESTDPAGSDSEPGEIPASKKSRITPVVWDASGKAPLGGGRSSQGRLFDGSPAAGGRLDDDSSDVRMPDQSRWGASVKKDAAATAMDELDAFRRQQARKANPLVHSLNRCTSLHGQPNAGVLFVCHYVRQRHDTSLSFPDSHLPAESTGRAGGLQGPCRAARRVRKRLRLSAARHSLCASAFARRSWHTRRALLSPWPGVPFPAGCFHS